MRKLIGFIFLALIVTVSACNSDSYAKRLEREEKAIERFLVENGMTAIYDFPVDTIFEEGKYYKDAKTGVYIHIYDKGTGKAAQKQVIGMHTGSSVSIRFYGARGLGDTLSASNGRAPDPIKFVYGNTTSYTGSSDSHDFAFKSPALALPLAWARNNSSVSLIIPFNYGSLYQAQNYRPVFIDTLSYTYY